MADQAYIIYTVYESSNCTLLTINLDNIINSVLFVQNGKKHIALNPEWGC